MIGIIVTAAVSFISTNIDDIFLLTILFSAVAGRMKVIAGQYIGISALIAISVAGAYGAAAVLADRIWLLGIVPVIIGIRSAFAGDGSPAIPQSIGTIGTAGLVVSNGADNIGVYIPIFSQLNVRSLIAAIVVYLLLTGVLCYAALKISDIRAVKAAAARYSRVIVPAVLVLIGLSILSRGLL